MAATKQAPAPTVVDKFRSYESELSTVFGFIVVVVIGVALLFFLRRATLKPTPSLVDLGAQTTSEDLMKGQNGQTTASPAPGTNKAGSYTVKAGDHLWKIAQSQMGDGYQWTTIAKANNIKAPYVVRAGQTLTIPSADPTIAARLTPPTKPTAVRPTTPTKTVPQSGAYTVVKGDNLWKIAVTQYKDGYKWVNIYNANKNVIGKNPGVIKAGQRLTIPSLK